MTGFWRAAFRPFFLGAGLWAMIAPAVWLWPDGSHDPVLWHLHELMFGMGGAAVAGYLLTALPNWTARGAVGPGMIAALALGWAMARAAMVLAGGLPAAIFALLWFSALSAVLLREVVAAKAWGRVPLALVPAWLGLADMCVLWLDRLGSLGPEAPILLTLTYATLIGGIGGRAVPAFVRSWLSGRGFPDRVFAPTFLTALGAAGTIIGAMLSLTGRNGTASTVLVLTGAGQIARMAGWALPSALRHPPLAMLLAGWVWLGAGLVLTGLALGFPDRLAIGDALHGLTMGAMGTMILAIAGRAAMRRRGAELEPPPPMLAGFACVWLSALVRVCGPWAGLSWPDPVTLAAGLWMVGWGLFLVALFPALRGPAPHPVLSARRGQAGQ